MASFNSTIDPSFGDVSLHVVPVSRLVVDVVLLTIIYWTTFRIKNTPLLISCHALHLARYLIAFIAYYQDFDLINGAYSRAKVWDNVDIRPLVWSDFVLNGLAMYGLYSKGIVLIVVSGPKWFSWMRTLRSGFRMGIATGSTTLTMLGLVMYWGTVTHIPFRWADELQLVPRSYLHIFLGGYILFVLNVWASLKYLPGDEGRHNEVSDSQTHDVGLNVLSRGPDPDPVVPAEPAVPAETAETAETAEPAVTVDIADTVPLVPIPSGSKKLQLRIVGLLIVVSLYELFLSWVFVHAKGNSLNFGPSRSFDPTLPADIWSHRTLLRTLAILF